MHLSGKSPHCVVTKSFGEGSPTIPAGAILSLYKTLKFSLEQRLEGSEHCPCFEPKEFGCERNYIQPNDDDDDKIKILIIQVLPGVIFLTDTKS